MANLLVTGATGLIGRHLVPELLARGHTVTTLVRHKTGKTGGRSMPVHDVADAICAAAAIQASVAYGDLHEEKLGTDLDPSAFEGVIHLAAVYDLLD